jgi:hypothetical protein
VLDDKTYKQYRQSYFLFQSLMQQSRKEAILPVAVNEKADICYIFSQSLKYNIFYFLFH